MFIKALVTPLSHATHVAVHYTCFRQVPAANGAVFPSGVEHVVYCDQAVDGACTTDKAKKTHRRMGALQMTHGDPVQAVAAGPGRGCGVDKGVLRTVQCSRCPVPCFLCGKKVVVVWRCVVGRSWGNPPPTHHLLPNHPARCGAE